MVKPYKHEISGAQEAAIFPYPFGEDGHFDPYNRPSDRWLYDAAHGDSRLLSMLLTKEAQQQMAVERREGADQADRLVAINRGIARRQKEIGL